MHHFDTATGWSAASLLLVLLATPGCGPARQADRASSAPNLDTVVVANFADIRGVNELVSGATPIHTALHSFILFLPLLEEQADYQERPPSFKPQLAVDWAFSDDRLSLTFHLRRGVVWSDGEPVTAEDVRWTWQAQTHPAVGWTNASSKRHIRDVEVVDAHTVRFHYSQVSPTQLVDANMGSILPRHVWSRLPFEQWRESSDWFLENLVVDGPFNLESWEPGQRFVVVANERYYEPGKPKVKRIVFRLTPEREAQLALLRSGEAHLLEWARPADIAALEANPEIEILSYIQRGIQSLLWNTRHPLFASVRARRALTLAIDRQTIIDTLYHGYARINPSPYPSNSWAWDPTLEPLPYDPQRARELLAEEGWSDADGDGILDREGQPFRFEILTPAGNELRQDILVMVQDQLKRIGVDARQRSVEANTQVARLVERDFEATFVALGVGTNLDLSFYFHSDSITGGYNFGSYSNPEVDQLLDAIRDQIDPLAAKSHLQRLQALLRDEQPVTILYEPLRMIPHHRSLTGLAPNSVSAYFNIQNWELRAP